jgi:transcriptional regulator with XRE-family HTH domain
MTFGHIIKRARIAKKLRQADATRLVGVTQATWSLWEREDGYPSDTSAKKIAGALDLNEGEILKSLKEARDKSNSKQQSELLKKQQLLERKEQPSDINEFNKTLRNIRLKKGYDYEDAAVCVGVYVATWAEWEGGYTIPTNNHLILISHHFAYPFHQLQIELKRSLKARENWDVRPPSEDASLQECVANYANCIKKNAGKPVWQRTDLEKQILEAIESRCQTLDDIAKVSRWLWKRHGTEWNVRLRPILKMAWEKAATSEDKGRVLRMFPRAIEHYYQQTYAFTESLAGLERKLLTQVLQETHSNEEILAILKDRGILPTHY